MLRPPRIAARVFFAVLSVTLCVFLGRSYDCYDSVLWHCFGEHGIGIASIAGRIVFGTVPADEGSHVEWLWRTDSEPIVDWRDNFARQERDFKGGGGFGVYRTSNYIMVLVPHWFLVLLTASLAAAPQIRSPLRFSLAAMFIATTLEAVVLGTIVWLK